MSREAGRFMLTGRFGYGHPLHPALGGVPAAGEPDSSRVDELRDRIPHESDVRPELRSSMRMRPARLNAAIATLFIVGSACFVLGAVPAYLAEVGGVVDGVTYFVGSVFFTAASFLQLLQAQTPSMTGAEEVRLNLPEPMTVWSWQPHDRNWLAAVTQFPGTLFFNASTLAALSHNASVPEQDRHMWRPDLFGSTLFLVSSAFGILAIGAAVGPMRWSFPRWIAWLNMVGSILFMAAALASYVVPGTGDVLDLRIDVAGTLLGALCFLIGAALMFPAWRRAGQQRQPARAADRLTKPRD